MFVLLFIFSGSNLISYSGEGGQATAAGVNGPTGVCIDTVGIMYITTAFNRVHKLDTSGIFSMFAGTGDQGFTGDGGQATSAKVTDSRNCVLDSSGNVYISDFENKAVRVVTVSTKIITKYAGVYGSLGLYSGDDGPATSAKMTPQSVFMDSTGNLYVGDSNGNRIRKITAGTKIITRFAGTSSNALSGMDGPATSASMAGNSKNVAGDNMGNMYIGSGLRLFYVEKSTNLMSIKAGIENFPLSISLCFNLRICLYFRNWNYRK